MGGCGDVGTDATPHSYLFLLLHNYMQATFSFRKWEGSEVTKCATSACHG